MKLNMMHYILEEEKVLLNIIENFKNIEIKGKKNILILATGSSYNAVLSVKYFLQDSLNANIHLEEPFNYINYSKINENIDLAIFITQSGKSTSIINAFEFIKLNSGIKTLCICADSNSLLSKKSDMFLDLNIGEEKVGFVTKGFSATILNLILLGIYNSNNFNEVEKIKQIIKYFPKVIKFAENLFYGFYEKFKTSKRFICISYGNLYGIAKEFETKFTETVRIPSTGYELEAYMHGPYLEANDNHLILFLNYCDKNKERANKLSTYMKNSVLDCIDIDPESIGINFEYSEVSISLIMALIIQILSYKTSKLKGIDLDIRIFDDFDKILKSKI